MSFAESLPTANSGDLNGDTVPETFNNNKMLMMKTQGENLNIVGVPGEKTAIFHIRRE